MPLNRGFHYCRGKISHVESPCGRHQNTAKLNAALQAAKRNGASCRSPQPAASATLSLSSPPYSDSDFVVMCLVFALLEDSRTATCCMTSKASFSSRWWNRKPLKQRLVCSGIRVIHVLSSVPNYRQ